MNEPKQPDPPSHGPSDETLKKFLPQMEKFIKEHPVKGKIIRPRGHTVLTDTQENEVHCTCPVCMAVSVDKSMRVPGDITMHEKTCRECQAELDQGKIAINCPDGRYCFVYNSALASLLEKQRLDAAKAGKPLPRLDLQTIGNKEFDLLQKHVEENRKKQAENE